MENRSHGATKVLQKPFRDQRAKLIEGRRNTYKEGGRKLITHLQSKIKGTHLASDVWLGQVLWGGTVTSRVEDLQSTQLILASYPKCWDASKDLVIALL